MAIETTRSAAPVYRRYILAHALDEDNYKCYASVILDPPHVTQV